MFRVWAPNAQSVKVACDKNGWQGDGMELAPFGETGIWTGVFRDIQKGE